MASWTLLTPERLDDRPASTLAYRSRGAAGRIGVLVAVSLHLLAACGKSPGYCND